MLQNQLNYILYRFTVTSNIRPSCFHSSVHTG